MLLTQPDVWTHILDCLKYKDLYSLRCVNRTVVALFKNLLIKSLTRFKYQQYRQYISALMIKLIDETVNAEGGTIYFQVTDINFKLYEKIAADEFNYLQDYKSDLHFYCTDPFIYDEESFEDQSPKRQLFIAHQSPFNIDLKFASNNLKPFEKEIYIQIDPTISKYLTHPSYTRENRDRIYAARKYPVTEYSNIWSDPDEDFRNDCGPLENFWPLDPSESKTVDSYNITSSTFVDLLSKIFNKIEKCWIVSPKNLDRIVENHYFDLQPYLIEKSIINAGNDDYSQSIIKFEKFN